MYQMHDNTAHSSDARRNFNIFLSLFGGLMAVAVLLGAILQAVISGNELDAVPVVVFGAIALALVNIAGFLLYRDDEAPEQEPELSDSDEFSALDMEQDTARQLEE